MAKETPERVTGVFFFACCVDETGLIPFRATPVIDRIYNHHVREYGALSPTPGGFERMRDDLGPMQRGEPNYSAAEMATISVPVWSVVGENDEFIKAEHAEYIARSIPGARFVLLKSVSHFAPMQRPELFNDTVLEFLATVT
jgi:pimeloyl-ACP methyl ester carboxylesterase